MRLIPMPLAPLRIVALPISSISAATARPCRAMPF